MPNRVLLFFSLFISLYVTAMLFYYPAAFACRGKAPDDPRAALSGAEAVFLGKVIEGGEKSRFKFKWSFPHIFRIWEPQESEYVKFAVREVWKGPVMSEITVYSPHTCAAYFENGETYIVYAATLDKELKTHGAQLMVTMLNRQVRSEDADLDFAALGKGSRLNSMTNLQIFLPIAVLMALIAIASLLLWRLNSKRSIRP